MSAWIFSPPKIRNRLSSSERKYRVEPGAHAELRRALPGVSLVQVIHVVDASSVDEALAYADEEAAA